VSQLRRCKRAEGSYLVSRMPARRSFPSSSSRCRRFLLTCRHCILSLSLSLSLSRINASRISIQSMRAHASIRKSSSLKPTSFRGREILLYAQFRAAFALDLSKITLSRTLARRDSESLRYQHIRAHADVCIHRSAFSILVAWLARNRHVFA